VATKPDQVISHVGAGYLALDLA